MVRGLVNNRFVRSIRSSNVVSTALLFTLLYTLLYTLPTTTVATKRRNRGTVAVNVQNLRDRANGVVLVVFWSVLLECVVGVCCCVLLCVVCVLFVCCCVLLCVLECVVVLLFVCCCCVVVVLLCVVVCCLRVVVCCLCVVVVLFVFGEIVGLENWVRKCTVVPVIIIIEIVLRLRHRHRRHPSHHVRIHVPCRQVAPCTVVVVVVECESKGETVVGGSSQGSGDFLLVVHVATSAVNDSVRTSETQ